MLNKSATLTRDARLITNHAYGGQSNEHRARLFQVYAVLVIDGKKGGPRSYVHDPKCPLIENARGRTHAHYPDPCESPYECAARWDMDNDTLERGLPRTRVCKCAK